MATKVDTLVFNTAIKTMIEHQIGQPIINAAPLLGGLSNRCWRVDFDSFSAVWRPVAKASDAFAVSRLHESQVLLQLQEKPFSPNVLLLVDDGLLVEWLAGEVHHTPCDLDTMMSLQARIHQCVAPVHTLDVHEKAALYWRAILPDDKHAELESVFNRFQQTAQPYAFPLTCCHFDLGYYNVIRCEDQTDAVIDWEYSAAGDPALDLAMTIQANDYEREAAVNAYCRARNEHNIECWQNAVIAWQPWCDYLAMLWYFAGAQVWQDQNYRDQGKRLLNQLL
ncbi:phosphotransferase [Photobacterium sanguinicancri]|uniref:Thiamine kinase n=1 Tax=Photobacterium sanguinicancri TaxID=875932 RepID=A0ABX4G0D2_9GAMM|nr:phosphotransferase [Photobacterium sanguinicancri]OZS44623.1 thiamine kinase [Photobacterium sanguinicancri]